MCRNLGGSGPINVQAAKQHMMRRHAMPKMAAPALSCYLPSGFPLHCTPPHNTAGVLLQQGHSNAPDLGQSAPCGLLMRKAACALHPKGYSWLPGRDCFTLYARHMQATCYTPGPDLCLLHATCQQPALACYSIGHACYMLAACLHVLQVLNACYMLQPRLSQRAAHNMRHPLCAGTTLSATCSSCLLFPQSRCWCQCSFT